MSGLPVKRLTEMGGRRMPFLRWSFLRMAIGMPKLLEKWQVGDGREEKVAQYVLADARPGTSTT